MSILIANVIRDNSMSFLNEIKDYLTTHSILPHLYKKFSTKNDDNGMWNLDAIKIAQRVKPDKTPSVTAAGADKALTSQHYDLIIADDIINRQTVSTGEQIRKSHDFYNDLMDLRKKPYGEIWLVGTRWDDKDLYGTIIRREKQLKADGKPPIFDIYIRKAVEKGKVIHPKRFTLEILDELKRDPQTGGTYHYSCQYLNDPVPREDRHFKDPHYWYQPIPLDIPRLIVVDPAIGENRDSKRTCVAIIAKSTTQIFVEKYFVGRFDIFETLENIFKAVTYVKQPLVNVLIETVYYQKVLAQILEKERRTRNLNFRIVPINPHRDKFTRIMALQPWWESKDLLIKPGMDELVEEAERFPRGETNDILDAVSMVVNAPLKLIQKKSRSLIPDRYKRPVTRREDPFNVTLKRGRVPVFTGGRTSW